MESFTQQNVTVQFQQIPSSQKDIEFQKSLEQMTFHFSNFTPFEQKQTSEMITHNPEECYLCQEDNIS